MLASAHRTDGCTSLNFWFKDQAKPQKVVLPLSGSQQLAMRRNIEKLVANKVLEKCDQPTEWCAPSQIVPKPNGQGQCVI